MRVSRRLRTAHRFNSANGTQDKPEFVSCRGASARRRGGHQKTQRNLLVSVQKCCSLPRCASAVGKRTRIQPIFIARLTHFMRHLPCDLPHCVFGAAWFSRGELGVCRCARSWCARTARRRGKVRFQPAAGRRSCLASSRLLCLAAAPCGARERRARSDGRRARGTRRARRACITGG